MFLQRGRAQYLGLLWKDSLSCGCVVNTQLVLERDGGALRAHDAILEPAEVKLDAEASEVPRCAKALSRLFLGGEWQHGRPTYKRQVPWSSLGGVAGELNSLGSPELGGLYRAPYRFHLNRLQRPLHLLPLS